MVRSNPARSHFCGNVAYELSAVAAAHGWPGTLGICRFVYRGFPDFPDCILRDVGRATRIWALAVGHTRDSLVVLSRPVDQYSCQRATAPGNRPSSPE